MFILLRIFWFLGRWTLNSFKLSKIIQIGVGSKGTLWQLRALKEVEEWKGVSHHQSLWITSALLCVYIYPYWLDILQLQSTIDSFKRPSSDAVIEFLETTSGISGHSLSLNTQLPRPSVGCWPAASFQACLRMPLILWNSITVSFDGFINDTVVLFNWKISNQEGVPSCFWCGVAKVKS